MHVSDDFVGIEQNHENTESEAGRILLDRIRPAVEPSRHSGWPTFTCLLKSRSDSHSFLKLRPGEQIPEIRLENIRLRLIR